MDSCHFPLLPEVKKIILEQFFDCDISDPPDVRLGDSYFHYYQKTVESCGLSSFLNHGEIANLVRLLKRPDATRDSVESILMKELSDQEHEDKDEVLQDSINLAVRLLLMIPIGPFLVTGGSITVSGGTNMVWNHGTITELVGSEIVPQARMYEHVRLEKTFNARNLKRIAGIDIRWTSNLADHLRMRDDDTAVEIFHYASFLKLHRECRIPLLDWQAKTLQTPKRSVISPALISETLRTLALLLPEHDKEVESWFRREQREVSDRGRLTLDPKARECGQLKVDERDISKFCFWHDRLVILKQAFDEAEPSNMKQWWHDRRKKVQWYTFWVAILVLTLTIFFGLVQCVEGGIQAYYTINPH